MDPRAGLDDMEKKNCCSHRDVNSDPLVAEAVASRYTDYAIPAHYNGFVWIKIKFLPLSPYNILVQKLTQNVIKNNSVVLDMKCGRTDIPSHLWWIWGSHSSDYEEYKLLACITV
jgi:hypothetical protein